MITRGVIEQIIDKYTVKVRIPLFNRSKEHSNATLSEDINIAKICTLPNVDPNIQVNDIVFVGFEDNNYGKPVVIGYMYRNANYETYADAVFQSLDVKLGSKLSSDTQIGDVQPHEIAYLSGVTNNIQNQLDILSQKIDKINSFLDIRET